MTWQQRLTHVFDPVHSVIGRAIGIVLALMVVAFCAIYVVGTYPISAEVRGWLDLADTAILVLFSIEYGLRFLAAESKMAFVFNWYSAVDLLSILPLWLGVFDIRVVKFVRLLKGFRILRLARYFQDDRWETNRIRADRVIIARIIFTLFTIVFVYAGLIYEIEHVSNPFTFRTFLDAFYFSVVTMTTVGYGDVTPVSDGGRLLTVLMILTGIALVPWQVGDLIQRLVRSQASIEIPCNQCGLAFHEADAIFCRRCGTALARETSTTAIDAMSAIDRNEIDKNEIDMATRDTSDQDRAAGKMSTENATAIERDVA